MTLNSKRKQIAEKVKEKLTLTCPAERLEALARQSAFVQRASSKMTGQDFLALMTTEMLEDPAVSLGGLCDILRQLNPQAVMTPQALHQRLNTSHAVAYMQEVLQLVLRAQLAPAYAQFPTGLLASFSRVFLEDSTQCRLHEKLADTFKGSGGSASTSTVKIDVIYELRHHQLQELIVTDGKAADQGHAAAILPHLRAGDLVIRDLGYFSLDALCQIVTKQAWFLSRLSNSVAVYPSAEETVPALALVEHLQRHAGQRPVVELAVYLGQPRLPCRLLAYRLPQEVVEQRQRNAYETARKKGRTPTKGYLNWLQFGWYITNVRAAIWAAEVVATVYRIRWQIELLFRDYQDLWRRPAHRPCTCPLRINIAGSPVDRHRGKKAWTRGLAWYPSGPFTPGDALTASRVGAHRLCRPPPRAASHHSCVLTLPPAAARVAHETITLRATSRHGP